MKKIIITLVIVCVAFLCQPGVSSSQEREQMLRQFVRLKVLLETGLSFKDFTTMIQDIEVEMEMGRATKKTNLTVLHQATVGVSTLKLKAAVAVWRDTISGQCFNEWGTLDNSRIYGCPELRRSEALIGIGTSELPLIATKEGYRQNAIRAAHRVATEAANALAQ